MEQRTRIASAALFALAAAAGSSPAHAITTGVGLRLGTLGFGAEGTVGLNNYLNLRVPLNLFNYNYDKSEDGVDYHAKLRLQSFGAQLDAHPFKGSFFLTAGLFSNGNRVKLHASDPSGTEEYDIGDATYTSDPNDPLNIDGKLDFKSMAPYAGLGWGNPIQGDWNLYFRFELGAYFQGAGKLKLDANGSAVNQANGDSFDVNGNTPEAQEFQANLEDERAKTEDDISKFKIYPAISFTVGYRFKF